MKYYLKLLRPKDWAKNCFLFVPSFFARQIFTGQRIEALLLGFAAFSFFASSIYIINDLRDIEDDKKHPSKSKRPLASGKVKPAHACNNLCCTFAIRLCAGLSGKSFLRVSIYLKCLLSY